MTAEGVKINRDPFDPEAAFFTGAWYLDRIYRNSVGDGESFPYVRQNVSGWESAIAFYTARAGASSVRPFDRGFD